MSDLTPEQIDRDRGTSTNLTRTMSKPEKQTELDESNSLCTMCQGHAKECRENQCGCWDKGHRRHWLEVCAEHDDGLSNGWLPIETAPKDGTHVLLCWAGETPNFGYSKEPPHRRIGMQTVGHWHQGWYASVQLHEGGPLWGPTHWRPLLPMPGTAPRPGSEEEASDYHADCEMFKRLGWLEPEQAAAQTALLARAYRAMRRYEMDVDDSPTEHRNLMEEIKQHIDRA